jgi:hypothetical protein
MNPPLTIELTPEQKLQLVAIYPSFTLDEVEYDAELSWDDQSFDHEFGTEKIYSREVSYLVIHLGGGKWVEVKEGKPIDPTYEQLGQIMSEKGRELKLRALGD